MHLTFHVSCVKPAKESPLVPASRTPLPPWIINGDTVYSVKHLVAVCHCGQGWQYLVDLEGYGPEEGS